MASTNKTRGYKLSQFIGTDKPSWLGDYNGDMLKIDTALTSINATATGAASTGASATSQAQSAQKTANSALSKANQNSSDIQELKNDLTSTYLESTKIGNADRFYVNVYHSNYLTVIKILINWDGKPNNTTVSDDNTLFPFASVSGNIFNQRVGTINGNNVFMGTITIVYTSDGETKNYYTGIYAYYDGANTIFYQRVITSIFNSATSLNYTFGTCTYLPSNVITPD